MFFCKSLLEYCTGEKFGLGKAMKEVELIYPKTTDDANMNAYIHNNREGEKDLRYKRLYLISN